MSNRELRRNKLVSNSSNERSNSDYAEHRRTKFSEGLRSKDTAESNCVKAHFKDILTYHNNTNQILSDLNRE